MYPLFTTTPQLARKTLKDSEIELICKNIISSVVENTGAVLREK